MKVVALRSLFGVFFLLFVVSPVRPVWAQGTESQADEEEDDGPSVDDIKKALKEDFRSHDIRQRWVGVMLSVLDARGETDPDAVAAGMYADLVIRSTYGWGAPRWKFIVAGRESSSMEVSLASAGYNGVTKAWRQTFKEFAEELPGRRTVVLYITVVIMPEAKPLWIFTGAYMNRGKNVKPVFRTLEGGIRRASEEVFRIMKAADRR